MDERISKQMKKLERELDSDRYKHTLGVMYTAGALAMRYGADLNKALMAGLLHDCAKCLSHHKKLKICNKHKIAVNDVEKANPGLLHAKVGAYLAKNKYGVNDEAVISAITWHTTGKPDMSLLDKIVYIADFIEPNRFELPNMQEIRTLAFQDIDECLYRILYDSLEYFDKKNVSIDSMTEQTYEYYKNQLGK